MTAQLKVEREDSSDQCAGMVEYLKAVDCTLQGFYSHWLMGGVLWTLFLAATITSWFNNGGKFLDLRRLAIEEARILRRRIYSMRSDDARSPRSEFDWIDQQVWFEHELVKIAEVMEHHGFLSGSGTIRHHCNVVRALMETGSDLGQKRSEVKGGPLAIGAEMYNQLIDESIRHELMGYWRGRHQEMLIAFASMEPTFLE